MSQKSFLRGCLDVLKTLLMMLHLNIESLFGKILPMFVIFSETLGRQRQLIPRRRVGTQAGAGVSVSGGG